MSRTGWVNGIRAALDGLADVNARDDACDALWELEQALEHAEGVAFSRRETALRAMREVDHILSHNPNVHDKTRAVRVLRDAIENLYPEFDWERGEAA